MTIQLDACWVATCICFKAPFSGRPVIPILVRMIEVECPRKPWDPNSVTPDIPHPSPSSYTISPFARLLLIRVILSSQLPQENTFLGIGSHHEYLNVDWFQWCAMGSGKICWSLLTASCQQPPLILTFINILCGYFLRVLFRFKNMSKPSGINL